MISMNNLTDKKTEALKQYKDARETYMNNPSNENWISFCEAKRVCMLMGCRI